MNDNSEDSVLNDSQFERFFEELAQKQQYQLCFRCGLLGVDK